MERGARVLRPDRGQLCWDMVDLDSQIEADHPARVVWGFVEGLQLDELYASIKAREGVPGRPTPDPRLYLALWLYATIEGIGSARALERLCRQHAAYRWLCGRVPVNYHDLSDFRSGAGAVLDRLLGESVAALVAEGLVGLDEVAVDGTKLAAQASRSSLRDADGLARLEAAARERVERLKAELAADPAAGERRRKSARARAAKELEQRVAAAQRKLAALRAEKEQRAKTHKSQEAAKQAPKVSSSDPEARLMKMADGSFRLAYNLILSVAPEPGIILGVMATDRRNEAGLATPMLEEIERRYGRRPARLLVDTRLATIEEIAAFAGHGKTLVYAPPPADKEDVKPATARRRAAERAKEPAAVKEWRERMASAAGKLIYRRRKLIETVNAHLKNPGWRRLVLRGPDKVRCEALLHALAHNICRGHRLRLAAAQKPAAA